MDHEVLEMLESGAFQNMDPAQGKFLSNAFLLDRPVIS